MGFGFYLDVGTHSAFAQGRLSNLELEAVVSNVRIGRKLSFGRLRQLMTNVCEVSLIRSYTMRDFQGLIDTEMRWVRFVPKCVYHQHLHALNLACDFARHLTTVAEIGDQLFSMARKEVAIHDRIAMRHRQGCDHGQSQLEGSIDQVWFGLQISRKWIQCFESELKDTLEIAHRLGGGINWHRTAGVRKASEIIKAHDVISMRVGENYRIDMSNIFAQRLGSEIGSRVDDPRTVGRLDVN